MAVKPLEDRILIKPLDRETKTASGIFLPESATEKPMQGKVVATVAYYNGTGWPISPDGRGDSLVLVNFDGNPHDPKSWQGSLHPGGSPGNDEPQRFRQ